MATGPRGREGEVPDAAPPLEHDPELAQFLTFLLRASVEHPEDLVNVAVFTAGDDALFDGVDLEA